MEKVREILRTILYEIAVRTHRYRVALRIMAAMVVFVTTYLLILPAATLDHDEASRQGGISVPVLSSVISEEDSASTDNITSGDDSTSIDADPGQGSNVISAKGSGSSQNTDGSNKADAHNDADSDISAADSVNEPDESADLLNDAAAETDEQSSVDNDGSANLIYDGKGYTVRVDDDKAVLPEDTQLRVSEITEDSDPDEYIAGEV